MSQQSWSRQKALSHMTELGVQGWRAHDSVTPCCVTTEEARCSSNHARRAQQALGARDKGTENSLSR